jgi:hypothetical protein
LHGHGVYPGASGKRSGRALVQNLEGLAEVQEDLRGRHEGYLANGNEAYEVRHDLWMPARPILIDSLVQNPNKED